MLSILLALQGQVTQDSKGLFLDGERFIIRSGEMSPYRIPVDQWDHAIKMAKAMGLNTISFYTIWNQHQKQYGDSFDFETPELNISHWLELIENNGMKALIRPGPYICAEIDNGGIPAWFNNYNIRRIWDENYRNGVNEYLAAVADQIRNHTYENGGCIIMIQLENEYGYWPYKDQNYLLYLKNWYIKNGFPQQTFFIADNSALINQYMIPDGVNIGMDGDDAERNFEHCRTFLANRHNEDRFCFVSEIYQSWYTAFNETQAEVNDVSKYLEGYLQNNISFSIYMFYGGYNYGMMAGANKDLFSNFLAMATSYYDTAALDSAGLPTNTFYETRELIGKYYPEILDIQIPENVTFGYIENVTLEKIADFDSQELDVYEVTENYPNFEQQNISLGMGMYSFDIEISHNGNMTFNDIHDYAQIYMDGKLIKIYSYTNESSYKYEFNNISGTETHHFDVLTDSMGHINFGGLMVFNQNKKGLFNVYFQYKRGFQHVTTYPTNMTWKHFSITDNLNTMNFQQKVSDSPLFQGGIYRGTFDIKEDGNLFVRMDNWKRGYVFVNGHNLGRYWVAVGPDNYVYCPSSWLQSKDNQIVVLDLEQNEPAEIFVNDLREDTNNLSGGAIAGITVAVVVVVIAIAAIIIVAIKKCGKSYNQVLEVPEEHPEQKVPEQQQGKVNDQAL